MGWQLVDFQVARPTGSQTTAGTAVEIDFVTVPTSYIWRVTDVALFVNRLPISSAQPANTPPVAALYDATPPQPGQAPCATVELEPFPFAPYLASTPSPPVGIPGVGVFPSFFAARARLELPLIIPGGNQLVVLFTPDNVGSLFQTRAQYEVWQGTPGQDVPIYSTGS